MRAADHPLLTGMSASDLWWSDVRAGSEEGGVSVAHGLTGIDAQSELVRPGALGIFKVGDGHLVIDQLLWDSDQVDPTRSGQYIAPLMMNFTRRGEDEKRISP